MGRARMAAGAALLVAATIVAGPAQAGPNFADTSLSGLVLTGTCPGQVGVLKSVIAVQQGTGVWAPLVLSDPQAFQPLGLQLVPWEFLVTGEGLKTRHLTPGVLVAKGTSGAPAEAITCVFDGATKESGPFQIQVTALVRPR